jgi:hypothetical protein
MCDYVNSSGHFWGQFVTFSVSQKVIVLAKAGQSKASLIEKKSRDYRPRLMHLKKNKPDSNGTGPGRNEPAANKLT